MIPERGLGNSIHVIAFFLREIIILSLELASVHPEMSNFVQGQGRRRF
jgi:hypothetical protein